MKKEKKKSLYQEIGKLCFASLFTAWEKSLVMVSLKLEYAAWYWAYALSVAPLPAFMLVSPIGSYWHGMKSCYANFGHRCSFLICFFSVLILSPDWESTHLAFLTTIPQTSWVKSNMDMKLLRTCECKMQSFLFLKISCLYKYAWTFAPLTFLPYLLAILKFGCMVDTNKNLLLTKTV